jgi:hypothetical protein
VVHWAIVFGTQTWGQGNLQLVQKITSTAARLHVRWNERNTRRWFEYFALDEEMMLSLGANRRREVARGSTSVRESSFAYLRDNVENEEDWRSEKRWRKEKEKI